MVHICTVCHIHYVCVCVVCLSLRSIAVGVCSTGLCVTSLNSPTDNSDVVSWPPVAMTTSFIALLLVSVVIRLRDYFVYQVI